jgi:hypothetical protein
MRHSEQFGKVQDALSKAQAEFPQIDKNQEVEVKGRDGNFLYKFKYADLTEIVNKTRPSLSKNGISYTQSVDDFPVLGICFFTRLMCGGEWMDTGLIPAKQVMNCSSMKDVAAIATYGKRLSLSEALGVAADDDMDAPDDLKTQAQPSGGRQSQNQGGYKPKNNNTSAPPQKQNQQPQNNQKPSGQVQFISEDQHETIANLMIKHSLDGQDIENFFLTGFNVKPDQVTFAQADYLIKMLSVDMFSSLDLKLASEDIKTKREAKNQDPADFVIDVKLVGSNSALAGKKVRELAEPVLKGLTDSFDKALKDDPKNPIAKELIEASFKIKAFLKSVGV